MGRCDYSAVGHGFTVQEARRDAIERDREYSGHQEGYSGTIGSSTDETEVECLIKPKIAKRATVTKTEVKGARKWETVFVIRGGDEYRERTAKKQGEAIKLAKELAIQNQREYTIDIEKRLVGSTSRIACIQPKKSEMGQWRFSGEARC